MSNNTEDNTLTKMSLMRQSITYVGMGFFLLGYSDKVPIESIFFYLGIILFSISIVLLIIIFCVPNWVKRTESIVKYSTNILLLPLSIIAIPIGVFSASELSYFDIRVILLIIWLIFMIIAPSMRVFIRLKKDIKLSKMASKDLYNFFASLAIIMLIVGFTLLYFKITDQEITQQLMNINNWVYNPFVYMGIAVLCVFPMLRIRH